MKTNKAKWVLTILAVLTAAAGAAVAIGAYLKKKAKSVGEDLDYDSALYEEDDDYLEEDSEDEDSEDAEETDEEDDEETDSPEESAEEDSGEEKNSTDGE